MKVDGETVESLRRYFLERPDVRLAFLFGSAASGRTTDESDVDVGVYLRDNASENRIWRDLVRLLDTEVDLVRMDQAPATLTSAMLKQGIALVIRDKGLYQRLLLDRTMEAENFAEFVEEYGDIAKRSASLTPEDKARLLERLHFLDEEMAEIEQFRAVTKEEYLSDRQKRRNLERWAENILNATIDIAKLVLAAEHRPIPTTYQAALEALAILAGVEVNAAAQFSSLARLRNPLAHEYLEILHPRIGELVNEFPPVYGTIHAFLSSFLQRTDPPRRNGVIKRE